MKTSSYPLFLLLSLTASTCQSFVIHQPSSAAVAVKSTALFSSTEDAVQQGGISGNLSAALKKPSKTLAVVLDYAPDSDAADATAGDLSTASMQLRKLKASALVTSDVTVAASFCEEQSTAQGNFPGPCPVFFMSVGSDSDTTDAAIAAGVDAVIVDAAAAAAATNSVPAGVDVIYKVTSPDHISENADASATVAYLVDSNAENVEDILSAIPAGSVVLASMAAMQLDNAELDRSKDLKALGVTAILLEKACIGDNEDLEYATFVIDGMTKKKSSTFNMSGLTGSTNGHFGGVASSTSTTWLRMKER